MGRRLVWFPAFVSIALIAQAALASPLFNTNVGRTLGIEPPPCLLCHTTIEGVKGSATKPFALTLIRYGLTEGDTPTLISILNQMKQKGTDDSDGDGVGDIAELEQGRDPNINDITGKPPDDYPPPSYGCAVNAPAARPHDERPRLADWALLGACAMTAAIRRQRRAPR